MHSTGATSEVGQHNIPLQYDRNMCAYAIKEMGVKNSDAGFLVLYVCLLICTICLAD